MKRIAITLLGILLCFSSIQTGHAQEIHRITLPIGTKQIYHDNSYSLSAAKHVIKNGKSYGSLRSLTKELGAQLSYDSAKKQFVATRGNTVLRLTPEKSGYLLNGSYYKTNGQSTINVKGSLLIQLDVLTKAFADYIGFNQSKNAVVISYTGSLPERPTPPPKPENKQPEAYFETDKDSYKIGEKIEYKNLSKDDKKITNVQWSNNKEAFFEPGTQTIKLTVWDKEGLSDIYRHSITIEDEVLYTEDQYRKQFTQIGDSFQIDSKSVLDFPVLEGEAEDTGYNVARVNSPEQITGEFLHYQYTYSGKQRFAIHKQNGLKKPIKFYFTVHNPSKQTTTVTLSRYGGAGPLPYVNHVGKSAVDRYLRMIEQPLDLKITLKPGQTKSLLYNTQELLRPKDTVSIFADVESTIPVKYEIATAYPSTPQSRISKLPIADRDGIHHRGHFFDSERRIVIDETVGREAQRIVIGDGKVDPFQVGFDPFSYRSELNAGNHGLLYTVDLTNVAPNTLITLNPRGGSYSGAFYINGMIVNNNLLKGPSEAGVLYRTSQFQQRVQIMFFPAPGSSMPINLILEPLKGNKPE